MMDGDIRQDRYDDGSTDAETSEQKIRNFNINFGPQHPAPTAFCAWCWSLTARSWNGVTRISGSSTAAPKS
jgi:hypothetical protein